MRLAVTVTGWVLLATGCASAMRPAIALERPDASGVREISIAITKRGFEPASAAASVGETVRLVFTRTVVRSCVTSLVLWLDKDHTIERELPLDVPVAITVELVTAGQVGFACPMHMHGGHLDVR